MAKETKDHSFSLVEYLMIVMIVGIIVVFAVPFSEANKVQPKIREMKDNVNSILKAFDQVYAIDTLKVSDVEAFQNADLNYAIKTNNFYKYVNLEKRFLTNYFDNISKKKDFILFYKTQVRPLIKRAYLQKFDQYLQNVELISLSYDYEKLPELAEYIQNDKFNEYYQLVENNYNLFLRPGVQETFTNDIIDTIQLVKGLNSSEGMFTLNSKQMKTFNNINLVDVDLVKGNFFNYQLTADSMIVATTTPNFGEDSEGAQIIYDMQDEIYTVGQKKEYSELGRKLLDRSIETLTSKEETLNSVENEFKALMKPDTYDLAIPELGEKTKTSLVEFEMYVAEKYKRHEVDTYIDYYTNLKTLLANKVTVIESSIESDIMKHDNAKNGKEKLKTEIKSKTNDWEKLIALQAEVNKRLAALSKIEQADEAVAKVVEHKKLKESYLKSFHTIDYDWLILE